MRLQSRLLTFFIFLLVVTGCRAAANEPDEIVATQTQASTPVEASTLNSGYPAPQVTTSADPAETYPPSETFLPIAAYPEPPELETIMAYPPPTEETEIDSGSDIEATDPQLVNLDEGIPTLIEFFDEGCGTCRAMIPTLQELEREYAGEVNFIYLDTQDSRNERIMRRLNYRFAPHFFLLDGSGEVLESWIGQVDGAKFLPALNAALASLDED